MAAVKQESTLRIRAIVDSCLFSRTITALVVLNAVILGLDTYPYIISSWPYLRVIDNAILWIFVGELTLRLVAYRKEFLHDPWAVFDTVVVAAAFIPAQEVFSVLRVARVLRVLRLISAFPSFRLVIEGLLRAIPNIGAIAATSTIFMYTFAVMATTLYGEAYPYWFGSLHASLFSMFQLMTLSQWPDIVRAVMKTNPYSWIFFILYILVAAYGILNLIIAVMVRSMRKQQIGISQQQITDNIITEIALEIKGVNRKLDKVLHQSQDK